MTSKPVHKGPPITDRLVVRSGYAKVGRRGGIVYDWPRIRVDLWLAGWRGLNLREFCEHYGIAYQSAKNSKQLSVEEKRRVEAQAGQGYMQRLIARVSVLREADVDSEAESMSRVLKQFEEVALLLVARCHTRIAKSANGGFIPMPGVSTLETRALARAAGDAFDLYMKVIDARRTRGVSDELSEEKEVRLSVKEPKPVGILRKGEPIQPVTTNTAEIVEDNHGEETIDRADT